MIDSKHEWVLRKTLEVVNLLGHSGEFTKTDLSISNINPRWLVTHVFVRQGLNTYSPFPKKLFFHNFNEQNV